MTRISLLVAGLLTLAATANATAQASVLSKKDSADILRATLRWAREDMKMAGELRLLSVQGRPSKLDSASVASIADAIGARVSATDGIICPGSPATCRISDGLSLVKLSIVGTLSDTVLVSVQVIRQRHTPTPEVIEYRTHTYDVVEEHGKWTVRALRWVTSS